MKKILCILLMLTILLNIIPSIDVSAASYITVEGFLKYILAELKIPLNNQPYIDVALKEGIIEKGDFKNYKTYLTRTDAAVIAKRLDEKINLKYNYTQEVYDILSGCNYYDGRLYYNCKGKLYPEGATKDIYPAEQFLEEVLRPVLLPAFQKDNWAARGLRANYKYVYDSKGNITERYIEIGVVSDNEFDLSPNPFNDNSYIIKAWKKIKEGDRKFNMVLNYRISDINKVPEGKREAVAYVMAKGIFKGYSDGMYVLTRSFKGNEKITAAAAKDVVQKVLYPEKRALVSPEGLLIRTTNLPNNAGDFEYILECFPNEYYETRFLFTYYPDFYNGTADKNLYAYPKEVNFNFLYNRFYSKNFDFSFDRYKYFDDTISQVYKYLNCAFNVNYKTVNNDWKEELISCYAQFFDDRIGRWIDNYINDIKKNHVIVESEMIAIDPGTIYYCGDLLFVRAYIKYKITADSFDMDQNKLVYADYNKFINLKSGEWRYGIYDIMLDYSILSDTYYWGIHPLSYLSDTAFKESKK